MRKKGSRKTVNAFSLGLFVVSLWWLLLLWYQPQTVYQTHSQVRERLSDVDLQVAWTESFKGLNGVLPTTQLADVMAHINPFLFSLIIFSWWKTPHIVLGRQPLFFEQKSSAKNRQDDTKLAFFCNVIGNSACQHWMCEHLRHWSLLSVLTPCLFSLSPQLGCGVGEQAHLLWDMPIWERDQDFTFSRQPWSLCVILFEIPSLGLGDEKTTLCALA